MRVLEVFGEPISNGGQESFIFNVLKHIDMKDLKLDFYTPYYCDNDQYKELIKAYGGELVEENLAFTPGKSRHNIIVPLKRYLMTKTYDVVHIHSGSMSVLAYAAKASSECGVGSIIVHSHCTGLGNSLKYRLTKTYMAYLFNRFPTRFCACSKDAGERMFPTSIVRERLQIIRNGIELERFRYNESVRKSYRKRLGVDDDTLVLGHVGRFSLQKNQMFDLELMRCLKRKSLKCKLILIGDGELKKELLNQVDLMGLGQDILFQGVVTNVQDYLQAMDVFILPSLFEGLGIVGVEAQAAGLPTIVSEYVPKELQLTDHIWFEPLNSVEKWVERIRTIADHSRTYMSDIEILRDKGYSIEQTASDVRDLYFS